MGALAETALPLGKRTFSLGSNKLGECSQCKNNKVFVKLEKFDEQNEK